MDKTVRIELDEMLRGMGSLSQASRDLGVSRQTIYMWLNGQSDPQPHHAVALERLTGISRERIRPDVYAI